MIDQFGYWDLLLGFVQATVDLAKIGLWKRHSVGIPTTKGEMGPRMQEFSPIFGHFNGENDLFIPQNHVILRDTYFQTTAYHSEKNPTRNPSLYVFESYGPRVSIQTDE